VDYVQAVLDKRVRVMCSSAHLCQQLAANRAVIVNDAYELPCPSKQELADTLQFLQRLGLLFADEPAGWPPAAVFQQFRDEGLVVGSISTVTWRGPGQPVLGKA
jgi:hypothetical protein